MTVAVIRLVDDVGVGLGSGVTGVVSVASITMAVASVFVVTIGVNIFFMIESSINTVRLHNMCNVIQLPVV